jgi:hypothetical protein
MNARSESSRILARGGSLEEVVAFLRREGLSKVETLQVLTDVAGISLGRAKEIVHLSPVWRDAYEADESLHDDIERVIKPKGE